MFGFLKLKSCGLTPQEQQIYRSHFCGVCHAMTEFGGRVSSLLTNYDITFWLLLCSALDSGLPTAPQSLPCTALPFRKVAVKPLSPKVAQTMASLNLLLVDSKVADDRQDGERLKAGVAKALFGKRFDKARAYLRETGFPLEKVLELPERQAEAEARESPTMADLCLPTESTLGEIFAALADLQKKPELEKPLRAFGESLGGYLYLWDALSDRESDKKKKRFNALESTAVGKAKLRAELDSRLQRMKKILDSFALGPEGKLCYSLLNSLASQLQAELPGPRLAATPTPRKRLAKAGMVHTQDCCEIDCCECGSCCDCNLCDCSPGDGEHCCEFNCCDGLTACICCLESGGNRRSCLCDDCTDIFCLESFCCGESRRTTTYNYNYVSDNQTKQTRPGLFQRLRNLSSKPELKIDTAGTARMCPACDRLMMTLGVGEIEIDECRNCGGFWLDDQEIEVLARTARLPHNLLNRYPTGEHSLKHLPGERPCPVCDGSLLVSVPYLGVPVEMCKQCHGFWLEHGVPRRVLKAKRSPRRLMKSHKKEWRCPYCEQVAPGGEDVCDNCGAPRPKSGFTGKLA